ncbi:MULTISPECIES: hypothetical protein [unclassified Acinetobacter]|uniref:hypothetical protein n=1 Tax=unclassified Acinetobacter TaxID=196816 RepID=UPI002934B61C|nr:MULTISPECIES: hypothetical protein [unclassified Acinetobacter]WOE31684.1 hypothetical protein QSG84_00150 [Acinetobacter sp. SAAs470]WOE37149.1 hypothetical protein QSG86_09195 [Acinetobacter sp. SAAs474]
MNLYLEFNPFDHPTQLSKVGHWVITFHHFNIASNTQLAISYVLPRQADQDIQIRRLIIESTQQEIRWKIIQIDAFNGKLNQEVQLDITSPLTRPLIQGILQDFQKYDVNIEIIASE